MAVDRATVGRAAGWEAGGKVAGWAVGMAAAETAAVRVPVAAEKEVEMAAGGMVEV